MRRGMGGQTLLLGVPCAFCESPSNSREPQGSGISCTHVQVTLGWGAYATLRQKSEKSGWHQNPDCDHLLRLVARDRLSNDRIAEQEILTRTSRCSAISMDALSVSQVAFEGFVRRWCCVADPRHNQDRWMR